MVGDDLKGFTGMALEDISNLLDDIIEPFLLSPLATLLALFLIMQFHVLDLPVVHTFLLWIKTRIYPEETYWIVDQEVPRATNPTSSNTLRLLGLNIIVFQIYYCGYIPSHTAFVHSCLWLFFESCVLFNFFAFFKKVKSWSAESGFVLADDWQQGCIFPLWIGKPILRGTGGIHPSLSFRHPSLQQLDQQVHAEYQVLPEQAAYKIEKDGSDEENKLFCNVYMDISKAFRVSILYWVAAIGLMSYYVYHLNSDANTHTMAKVSGVKWLLGVILTTIAGEDQVGSTYDDLFWNKLFKLTTRDQRFWKGVQLPTYVFGVIPLSLGREWQIRAFMDWSINAICRILLLGTAPIMLCVEDPMDFIKDVLAVFFICKLDDYDDAKSWKDIRQIFIASKLQLPFKGVEFKDSDGDKVKFQIDPVEKTLDLHAGRGENGGETETHKDVQSVRIDGNIIWVEIRVRDDETSTCQEAETLLRKVLFRTDVIDQHVLHKVELLYKWNESKQHLLMMLDQLDKAPHAA